jgi:putative Mg2+ transporter-C (MgtC) family protein
MGPELGLDDAVLRLGVVAVLAGVIGLERELDGQDAGVRTHILVGLGAALFVMAGNFAWTELSFGNSAGIVLDPSRVVAYVVTGVGFLGAGAIIKHGSTVRGLTTAASLWVVAAVGVVVGSGEYLLGMLATATVLLSLWPLKRAIALAGLRSRHSRRLVVELDPGTRVGELVRSLEARGLDVTSATVAGEDECVRVDVVVSGDGRVLADALDEVSSAPSVQRVSLVT